MGWFLYHFLYLFLIISTSDCIKRRFFARPDDIILSYNIVKDTGRGIDPEKLPKLFTKFATKSSSWMGLGLFISKSIIEAHGGKIWAENNSDGKGATFSFSLPIN